MEVCGGGINPTGLQPVSGTANTSSVDAGGEIEAIVTRTRTHGRVHMKEMCVYLRLLQRAESQNVHKRVPEWRSLLQLLPVAVHPTLPVTPQLHPCRMQRSDDLIPLLSCRKYPTPPPPPPCLCL